MQPENIIALSIGIPTFMVALLGVWKAIRGPTFPVIAIDILNDVYFMLTFLKTAIVRDKQHHYYQPTSTDPPRLLWASVSGEDDV